MSRLPLFLLAAAGVLCWMPSSVPAAESVLPTVTVVTDVPYKAGPGLSDNERERCTLDLYLPPAQASTAVLVWFHGGGLKAGDKQDARPIARSLAGTGLVVVCPNYRLSPNVHYPAYLDDAAAAVAWTHHHVAEHGGDPDRLFVGGHSAGAWLALMVGLHDTSLRAYGLETSALAGLIPVSGQTMTHFTVREERGIGPFTIIADAAAPVHHVRKDTPPMLLLYADNDMTARAEENAYFVALMQGAGNTGVTGRLVRNRDHGSIASGIAEAGDPARTAVLEFIRDHCDAPQSPAAIRSDAE